MLLQSKKTKKRKKKQKEMKSQPKHPGVKNILAKNLRMAMLKKCEIKMGNQDLLLLMELKF